MERQRIVYCTADLFFSKERFERIALAVFDPDHVLVVDMTDIIGRFLGGSDNSFGFQIFEKLIIFCRIALAGFAPGIQIPQFDGKNCRLKCIKTEVAAYIFMDVKIRYSKR